MGGARQSLAPVILLQYPVVGSQALLSFCGVFLQGVGHQSFRIIGQALLARGIEGCGGESVRRSFLWEDFLPIDLRRRTAANRHLFPVTFLLLIGIWVGYLVYLREDFGLFVHK